VLVLGLTTGHKIGLLVMAGIFIVFSLVSSFVVPRRNPNYPGRGLSVFVVVALALFVLMIAAVEVFGAEGKEKAGAALVHLL
jgi:hypothetical protein